MPWGDVIQIAGLLAAAEGVRTESFALGIAARNAFVDDDRVAVMLSSPLRIASGAVDALIPVAVTEAGDPVFDARRVSLASTSRELKLGVDYAMPVGERSSVSYVAAVRNDANHVEGEKEALAGVVYRTAF